MPGIRMSRMARSGACSRTSVTASSPRPVSPTTSYPCSSRISRRSRRMIASSSAMTTRTAKVGGSLSSWTDLGQVTSSWSRSCVLGPLELGRWIRAQPPGCAPWRRRGAGRRGAQLRPAGSPKPSTGCGRRRRRRRARRIAPRSPASSSRVRCSRRWTSVSWRSITRRDIVAESVPAPRSGSRAIARSPVWPNCPSGWRHSQCQAVGQECQHVRRQRGAAPNRTGRMTDERLPPEQDRRPVEPGRRRRLEPGAHLSGVERVDPRVGVEHREQRGRVAGPVDHVMVGGIRPSASPAPPPPRPSRIRRST